LLLKPSIHQPSLCEFSLTRLGRKLSGAFLPRYVFLVPVSPFDVAHAVAAALLAQQVLLRYTFGVALAVATALLEQVLLRYTFGVALAVATALLVQQVLLRDTFGVALAVA
jgi:hypothetical protein